MEDLMDSNKMLKKLLVKFDRLNKLIVDQQSIVVVPARRQANLPVSDLDIEEDYIFFCFAKFTKTLIAIQKLIEIELFEDALVLTRSNYECFIHAKSIIKKNDMINHLVEYKLGLIGRKRYKYAPSNRNYVIDIHTSEVHPYVSQVKDIAQKANESITYKHVYSYLCDITHCNLITSSYYRDGVRYSYKLVSKEAEFNVLLWNVYFNLKFYNTLIEAEIFEIEELEERVLDVLSSDSLKLMTVFEAEEKRIIQELKNLNDENQIAGLKKYLNVVEKLKRNLD